MLVDARRDWRAISVDREKYPGGRSAKRRISATQSERTDSDPGGWRRGAVGVDGHQPLPRAEVPGADAPRARRVGSGRAMELLGGPGDGSAAARFAAASRAA